MIDHNMDCYWMPDIQQKNNVRQNNFNNSYTAKSSVILLDPS